MWNAQKAITYHKKFQKIVPKTLKKNKKNKGYILLITSKTKKYQDLA